MKIQRRYKILFVLLVLFAIGGIAAYNYVYQDHRNISSENSIVQIGGGELRERFMNKDGKNLLNQTITVSGKVTKTENSAITLDESVYASFPKDNKMPAVNEMVSVKGRCIGYDELFEIVKLDQCSLIK